MAFDVQTHPVTHAVNAGMASLTLAAWIGWIPLWAAGAALVLYLIQIWESKTVQTLLLRLKIFIARVFKRAAVVHAEKTLDVAKETVIVAKDTVVEAKSI